MTENNKTETETETETIEWNAEEMKVLKDSMAELVEKMNSKHREIQDKKLLHEEQEIISQEKKLRTKLFSLKLQLQTLKSRKREVKKKRKGLQSANVPVKRFRMVELSKNSVGIQPIAEKKGKVIDCSQDTESESEESEFEVIATPGDTRVTRDGTVEVCIDGQKVRNGIGRERVWVPQISSFIKEFEDKSSMRYIPSQPLNGSIFVANFHSNDRVHWNENSAPEWFKQICKKYRVVWKVCEEINGIEIQPEIITDVVSLEN